MSTDLDAYKKFRINELNNIFNSNVARLNSQTSSEAFIENKAQGALTWSFIDCINKTPNCSWRELLKNMRDSLKNNQFTQIPQLSTDSFYDINSKLFI
jgi:hypothetical protein